MMHLPCESTSSWILPVFRSLVAKELIDEHSFTQKRAAEKLGTTQAAISQYLHSKRGYKKNACIEKFFPRIRKAAKNAVEIIVAEDVSADTVLIIFCQLCKDINKEITC